MNSFSVWVKAARLRTLPLSISGVIVGTALAKYYNAFDFVIFVLALLTTIGFQVTSNFANDYGDGVKGTDNEDRIGPKRVLQSGLLTRSQLKRGIIITILINILLVITIVAYTFGLENIGYILLFLFLGGLSIWAAIKYTVGESAYGYRGLGDLFVFLFFGILGVLGSMFLYTKFLTLNAVFPAITIGLLSTAVLNLNNLRDYESDKKSGKNTVIVKLGYEKGKVYHFVITIISFLSLLFFISNTYTSWFQFIPLLFYIPIGIQLVKVKKEKQPRNLDPELKKLALSTFGIAILFYFCYHYFL